VILLSGKVLIAGGRDLSGALASAELYDPSTGTWKATGSLNYARYGTSAILLPVMSSIVIAGGYLSASVPVYLKSAEIYEPSTGKWLITGNLNYERGPGRMITTLQNGKIVVAGGDMSRYFPYYTRTSELYDPATGIWTKQGNLTMERAGAGMVRLQNGKVLVAGGITTDYVTLGVVDTNTCDLYDPSTGTWTATGRLNFARAGPGMVLLPNGKVLIAGGSALASSELYDPSTGTWTPTGSLAVARSDHWMIVLLTGKVLCVTGTYAGGTLSSAELYDPSTGTWAATGSLLSLRGDFAGGMLQNGKVLVAGGSYRVDSRHNRVVLGTAEIYDPSTGKWTATGSLTDQRYGLSSMVLLPNGKLLLPGGFAPTVYTQLASTEVYDPTTGTWSATGNLNVARGGYSIIG